MAQLTGNTIYITSAEQITDAKTEVSYVIVTPTSGAATPRVIITDTSGAKTIKLELVTTTNESKYCDFSTSPMRFPNGINVSLITDCTVTLLTTSQGG